jgi:hypothetical protein
MIRISKSLTGFAESSAVSERSIEELAKRILNTYRNNRAKKEAPDHSSESGSDADTASK